ncbi:MAG: peptidoglycan-associated lipoprotein Pal [Gemmatimonadales bacterium]
MTSCRIDRAALLLAFGFAACSSNPKPAPAPTPVAPAVDSAALRARADSVRAAARRDSLAAAAAAARADSLARVRTDSLASASARARADSVHAQVLRDSAEAAARLPSGLDSASDRAIAQPIHFDYDRSDLKPEDETALDRKVAVLRANPRLELQIEGHCDERGPDEYNLALGERRAATTKRWLVEHGTPDARLTIISYGEERPIDPGHTEEAWAKNRRAEFRVTRSAR